MRAGADIYDKSLLYMYNWMPTLQGTAVRSPGTRFVSRLEPGGTPADTGRMVRMNTFDNRRILWIFTDQEVTGYEEMYDLLEPADITAGAAALGILNTVTQVEKRINRNAGFNLGKQPWSGTPSKYQLREGASIWDNGVWYGTGGAGGGHWNLRASAQDGSADWIDTCVLQDNVGGTGIDITKQDNNQIHVLAEFSHIENFYPDSQTNAEDQSQITLRLGTTPGGAELWDKTFTLEQGTIRFLVSERITLAPTWQTTDTVYPSVEVKAFTTTRQPKSSALWRIHNYSVLASFDINTTVKNIVGTVPFLETEIKDIQYVQSPYNRKELVLVHPNHPPQWIYFDTVGGNYVIEAIPFVDGAGDPDPIAWDPGNYPACCTAYQGRLVLAGANELVPQTQGYSTSNQETVWASDVGQWNRFSTDPDAINPDDSVQFTTIYRSQIQWVFGQKDLLVGAEDMEYITSVDGIFSPGDLGVHMHSSHGSARLQPVSIGDYVLFAAEAGTKLRAMSKISIDEGWTAPELTLYNPEITTTGIKRMVRMRNPHQMIACLLNNGTLALYHMDKHAGVGGWSRLDVGDDIIDIEVTVHPDGYDVLWLLVQRTVEGVREVHLEGIYDWTDTNYAWDYLTDSRVYGGGIRTQITGLEHLAGKYVDVVVAGSTVPSSGAVVSQTGYIGEYQVSVGGTINPVDDTGKPIEFNTAWVGYGMRSQFATLPLGAADPGASKRYVTLSARIRASTRPRVQVSKQGHTGEFERPAEREQNTPMNYTQPLDILHDIKVANLGSDDYQIVLIEERLPFRSEILGIYGKAVARSL
jgi:hypothetical protein